MENNQGRNIGLQKKLCCLVTWTLCLPDVDHEPHGLCGIWVRRQLFLGGCMKSIKQLQSFIKQSWLNDSYRCYWLLHPLLLSHSLWKVPFCRVWLFLISAVLYTPLIFLPFLVIAVTFFCSQKGLGTDKQENSCPVICWQYSISSFLHGSFRGCASS